MCSRITTQCTIYCMRNQQILFMDFVKLSFPLTQYFDWLGILCCLSFFLDLFIFLQYDVFQKVTAGQAMATT